MHANLARKPEGNDRAQVKAIWAGECDVSLGNTYYMGEMLSDSRTDRMGPIPCALSSRHLRTAAPIVNVSGVAMTKAAPNKAEALQLMEFLVSPEAQSLYADLNNEYPVLEGAALSDLVKSWGTFEADTMDLGTLAANRPAALRIMEEVNFDG